MLTSNLKTVKGKIVELNKLISDTGKIYKVSNIFVPINKMYEGYFLICMLNDKWCKIIRKIVVEKRDAKQKRWHFGIDKEN